MELLRHRKFIKLEEEQMRRKQFPHLPAGTLEYVHHGQGSSERGLQGRASKGPNAGACAGESARISPLRAGGEEANGSAGIS